MSDIISTTEAAEILEVSRQWILRLIHEDKLLARKIGPTFAVDVDSVKQYRREVQKKNDLNDN